MDTALPIRIFVSSPGDVAQERFIAQRVIERLQDEFVQRAAIEPVFWELEPCLASDSFQPQIRRPSQSEICVILFWSRLGTSVTVDGVEYASGTEYEFRDALAAFRATRSPSLLVYRKTEQRRISTRDASELSQIIQQQKAVDEFVSKWVRADDGNVRAFHEFETLAQFEERLEEHLRKLIERKLLHAGINVKAKARWSKGSPFRGLAPFEETHKDVYFGRTAAVQDVLDALWRQAAEGRSFLLITGMSGAGKSSLVRAGLLPVLARPGVIEGVAAWRHAVLRPSQSSLQGGDLIDGLAAALLRQEALPQLADADLAGMLRSNPGAVVPLLKRELKEVAADLQRKEGCEGPLEARLTLVVDQLEELFIDERVSPAQRAAFATALAELARSGVVYVIATLRSDFYGRISEIPDLMVLKEGSGHYDLRPPALAEIGLMIRKPAQMANLSFDVRPATGESLDDVLCAEAAKDPGALPLLQFVLEELYERRTPDGLLTFAAYEELGGLEGSLARRAEQVFSSLSLQAQQALPRVLAAIVRIGTEEDEELAQRRVPVAQLTTSPDIRALVTAFTDKRLFATDRDDGGTPVLGVAHEALLRRWPRVQEWAQRNRHLLRARGHIAGAVALWSSEGRSRNFFLPSGRALEDARALMSAYGEALTPDEQAFIAGSVAADNQRRQRRLLARVGAAAAGVILVAAGGLYWFFSHRETVEYYANYSTRWGVPEGVGPLSEDEAEGRRESWRFVRRGSTGPVERVDLVTGDGLCPSRHNHHNFLYLNFDNVFAGSRDADARTDQETLAGDIVDAQPVVICHWQFKVHDGKAVEETSFTREETTGSKVYTLKYDGSLAQYTSGSGYALPLLGAGVSNLKLQWVEDGIHRGRLHRVDFRNAQGVAKPNHQGAYGLKFNYNSAGLPERITYLGRDGTQIRTSAGIAVITLAYDSRNNATDIAFLDETNRPTRDNVQKVSGIKHEYDDRGNVTRSSYYDLRGKPASDSSNTWGREYSYDSRGRLMKISFVDEKGQTARNASGISQISFSYNEDGTEAKILFLDEASRRIRSKDDGVAGEFYSYDDRGRVNQQTFVDEADQPARSKVGHAITRFSYDSEDRINQLEMLDEDGRPTRTKAGLSIHQRLFNELGSIETLSYRDESRQLTRLPDHGYASIRRTYDDRGNLATETYLDERNRKARQRKGYAEVRYSYDSEGNKLEERFFDEEGRPVRSHDGFAIAKYGYDNRGMPIQEEYFNEEGEATESHSGFVKKKYGYDGRGNQVQVDYYFSGGQIAWRIQSDYNERDELVYMSFWEQPSLGGDLRSARIAQGCYGLRYSYDENGRKIQTDCQTNEPTSNEPVYVRERYLYDVSGNHTETRYYKVTKIAGKEEEKETPPNKEEEKETSPKKRYSPEKSYSREKYSYDARGNQTETSYYRDERRTKTSEGYATVRRAFDLRGNLIEESYYDMGGALTLSVDKVARVTWTYDELNRERERANFDAAGRPASSSAGFARKVSAYDRGGRLERIEFLGHTERPAVVAGSFAAVSYEYDDRGNVRDIRYFDEAERVVPLSRERLPRSIGKCAEVAAINRHAAELGNTDAQNMLGWMYGTGRCVQRDRDEAFKWYRRAVALNDTLAMSNLGMMMLKTLKTREEEKEFDEALRLVERSALSGNPFGQTNWGVILYRMDKNRRGEEAMLWFRRAAAQNNGLGQSHLGFMYEKGFGVPQGASPDHQEAEHYYRLAANNGVSEGMVNLGLLHIRVKKDAAEGARWLRKAADLGHPAAQANLGYLYAQGSGVRKDENEAIRWYLTALANRDVDPDVEDKVETNLKALQPAWLNATKAMFKQLDAQGECSLRYAEDTALSLGRCSVNEEEFEKQWKKDDSSSRGDPRKREEIIEERITRLKTLAAIHAELAEF